MSSFIEIDVKGKEIEAAILDCRQQGRLAVIGPEHFENGYYVAKLIVPKRREKATRRKLEHLSRLGEQSIKKIYSREIKRAVRIHTAKSGTIGT